MQDATQALTRHEAGEGAHGDGRRVGAPGTRRGQQIGRRPPGRAGRCGSRVRILRAAAGLFRQRRFDRTTMREIAEAVGLTKASLYHHIRSKQALPDEIIQHTVDRALPSLEQIATVPLPAAERLRQAVRLHVLILAHDRDNVECSIEEGRLLAPEFRDAVIGGPDRYERLMPSHHQRRHPHRRVCARRCAACRVCAARHAQLGRALVPARRGAPGC